MGAKMHAIKDKAQLEDITEYLRLKDIRFYIMWKLGISVGIRISDIVKLQKRNYSFETHEFDIIEQKTDKPKTFNVPKDFQEELENYIRGFKYPSEFLFRNKRTHKKISRTRCWQVIKEAARYFGLEDIGTHSMRKTFGYWYYRETGNIAYLQKIFNHSSGSITLLYIDAMDKDIKTTVENFSIFRR